MISKERLVELYGGLPREATVHVQGDGWWIDTPAIMLEGSNEMSVLVQGGIHSEYAQLSHKVRRFVRERYRVVCLSQSGSATTKKSRSFYATMDYARFVARDLAALDDFGVKQAIAYGSSLGAGAAIALAAEAPARVAAVIAVNPASLIKQRSTVVALNFIRAMFDEADRDFDPAPTTAPPIISTLQDELFGQVNQLVASDVGLGYLDKVRCPVLIYTGKQDRIFPWRRLIELPERFPTVQVIPIEGFVHSDPNSRAKIDWLVTDAKSRLQSLGIC